LVPICLLGARPPRRDELQRRLRQRHQADAGFGFRIVERALVDRFANAQATGLLVKVSPPEREQLAATKRRQQGEPHKGPGQQPWQLPEQRRRLRYG